MNSNPTSFFFEFPVDQTERDVASDTPNVSKPHAERIATLFREEHDKVVHHLVARTGSWAEARDIAAQAFSQVLGMKNPHAVGSIKAYVYSTARNIAADRHKLGAIRRRINGIARHELPSTSPSPEPVMAEEQRLEILQCAIEGLRPLWRMAITLRFWEKLTYREIVAHFLRKGVAVEERTVQRWVTQALDECRRAIQIAEGERIN